MLVAVFQAVLVSMIALQQGSLQHCKAQRGRLCAAGCRDACSDEDARLVAKTVARDLWYSATVAKVNADGTLDVQYDDGGEQEAAVMVSMVRPARARQAGASFTEGQRIEALYGSVTASARREMCARRCERGLKGKAEVGYVAACTAPEIAMGIPLSRHRQQHVYGRLEGVGRLLRPLRRRGGRGGAAASGELAGDDEWSGEGCPTAELGDAHVEGVLDGIFYGRAGARLPRSNRLLPQDQRDREAVDARAAQLGGGGTGCSEATYGEIPLASLLEALASPLVNMTSKDAFLDIGAGLGKHPLSVALFLRARRAAGVEFSHARFEASCAALRAAARVGFARAAARVEYVRGDAMALDLEPFDVVFTYSLCFRAPMVEALALQVLTYLLACLRTSTFSFFFALTTYSSTRFHSHSSTADAPHALGQPHRHRELRRAVRARAHVHVRRAAAGHRYRVRGHGARKPQPVQHPGPAGHEGVPGGGAQREARGRRDRRRPCGAAGIGARDDGSGRGAAGARARRRVHH